MIREAFLYKKSGFAPRGPTLSPLKSVVHVFIDELVVVATADDLQKS